jgi:hypothetical protein
VLHDPEFRLALAREHAESVRRQLASAHRPHHPRVPLRWQLGRVLVAIGLRLTREAPLQLPQRGRPV